MAQRVPRLYVNRRHKTEKWYFNGRLHRLDGPAIITPYVIKWCKHGLPHRLDGPAYISQNQIIWFKDGSPHRLDGPAVIEPFLGVYSWYKNGVYHREDGPAIIGPQFERWWVHGKLHRTTGPAMIDYEDTDTKDIKMMRWFISDKELTIQIGRWMDKMKIIWPWDEDTQTLFDLTWANSAIE